MIRASSIFKTAKIVIKALYGKLPFKKQLFLLLKWVWLPKQNLYQHLYFNGVFRVKVSKGHYFKIDHFGQQIENELFWKGLEGGWEKVSIQIWIKLCANAEVILDVGANTGLYSLVAKAISPNARVIAFEPVERVCKRLVKNNRINDFDIQIEEIALSNFDGKGIIYDTTASHILSVTVNKNLHPSNIESHPVKINVRQLATYAQESQIDRIDLMKIDVETHEPEVLEGMSELLAKFKPTLLIEILNDEVASSIQSLTGNLGYLYFDIDETKGLTQVSEIKKSSYYNYLLCSSEVAQRLRLI